MNRSTLREVALPLASLVVLVVVGWLAYARIMGNRVTSLNPSNLVSENGRVDLRADDPSAILPANLPVPADAAITQSFEVARGGEIQGTRSYESQRELPEELAAYEAYANANGWVILDRQEATGYAAFLAEREGRQLLCSFSGSGEGTSVTVTAVKSPATY
jgi:hypothetical protein